VEKESLQEILLLFSEVKNNFSGKRTSAVVLRGKKIISVGKEPLLLFSEVKLISVGKEILLLFSEVKNNFSGKRTSAVVLRVEKLFQWETNFCCCFPS
jgi:hypothetical protein